MAASAARPAAQKKQTPPKNNKLVFGVIGGVLVLGVAGFLLWTQVLKRDASDAARDAANGAAPIGQASAPRVVPPESAPAPIAAPDAATNDAMAAPATLPQAGTEAAEDYYGVDCDAYSGVRQSACDAWQKIHADEMRQRADAEYDDASSGDIDRERQQRELEQQRAELERQRQDLARQRKEADAQRRAAEAQREEAAAMAAQAERERAEREQRQAAEAAEQGPTANALYESRRRECPGGFLGSDCRKKIRNQVCEGHWASNPPPGYSECASSKRH